MQKIVSSLGSAIAESNVFGTHHLAIVKIYRCNRLVFGKTLLEWCQYNVVPFNFKKRREQCQWNEPERMFFIKSSLVNMVSSPNSEGMDHYHSFRDIVEAEATKFRWDGTVQIVFGKVKHLEHGEQCQF